MIHTQVNIGCIRIEAGSEDFHLRQQLIRNLGDRRLVFCLGKLKAAPPCCC